MIVNHLKSFNSQKLSCLVGLFGLKSFHGFVSLAQTGGCDCLSSVLFCIIILFFMASKKNFNMLQQEHTKTIK